MPSARPCLVRTKGEAVKRAYYYAAKTKDWTPIEILDDNFRVLMPNNKWALYVALKYPDSTQSFAVSRTRAFELIDGKPRLRESLNV